MNTATGSLASLIVDILQAEGCRHVEEPYLFTRVTEIRGARKDSTRRALERLKAEGLIDVKYSLWHETWLSLTDKEQT